MAFESVNNEMEWEVREPNKNGMKLETSIEWQRQNYGPIFFPTKYLQ